MVVFRRCPRSVRCLSELFRTERTLASRNALLQKVASFHKCLRRFLGQQDVGVRAVSRQRQCFASEMDAPAAGGIPCFVHQILRLIEWCAGRRSEGSARCKNLLQEGIHVVDRVELACIQEPGEISRRFL